MNTTLAYAEAKIEELRADETFMEAIASIREPQALCRAFAEKGEEMTLEQAQQILDYVYGSQDGELDADALDTVSGGLPPLVALGAIAFVGGSLLLGYVDGVRSKYNSCTTKKNKK